MALELWPQFTGGSYQRIGGYTDSERCINMYPETSGKGENNRSQMRLMSTPGTAQVADFFVSLGGLTGPIYDVVTATQQSGTAITPRTFALVGNGAAGLRLVEYRGTATAPLNWGLCGGQPASSLVQPKLTLCGSDQILISNGNSGSVQTGSVFSMSTGVISMFSSVGQPGWLGASDTDFLDGYAIAAQPGTQSFYISSLQDATIWDPLDLAVENDAPDTIVGLRVVNRDLFVFGKSRVLVWNNTGSASFPFSRNNSATIEVGCVNAQSIQKLNGSLFWMGRDQRGGIQAWKLQGYNPVRISTTGIEELWQNYYASGSGNENDLASVQAFSYQEEGHNFYVVNFPVIGIPSLGTTWVYDDTEGLWHERQKGTSTDGVLRQRCHTFNPLYGHLVGSRNTAQLFAQSRNIGTEQGVTLGRYRIAPHLYDGSYRNFYNRMVIDIDTGVSASAISLGYSNNGGVDFGPPISPTVTNRGSGVRLSFNRLGSGLDRVFGLTVSNPAAFSIAAAYLDVRGQQK
jgi:hypothetical protein